MKAGFLNTGMGNEPEGYKARFDHYERFALLWQKEIYEITINQKTPLMYRNAQGTLYRTDNHFWTDYGSIPPPLQSVPGLDRERHRFPYLFHDSAYQERGLWILPVGATEWIMQRMSRKDCDDMLYDMVRSDVVPGGWCNAHAIWLGVRIGGGSEFGKGDWRDRQPPHALNKGRPLPAIG